MTREKSLGTPQKKPVRRTRRTVSSPTKCSSPTKSESVAFRWGTPASRPKNVASCLTSKYYQSFTWENEKYRIGDFVLVSGAENQEPFVARLEELWDISDLRRETNYQGRVTWYERRDELEKKNLNVEFGSNEVVQLGNGGATTTSPLVDLEAICGHCNVVEVSVETRSLSPEDKTGWPQFFCRYTWNRRTLKPLMPPKKKPTQTPKKQMYGHDPGQFPQPYVQLEDIAKSPSKKGLTIKLKRMNDKENFKISDSPVKTPSKRPQKPLQDTVEKLTTGLKGVFLGNQRTPLRGNRNGTTGSACTPRSSKTERTTAATTRSGRTVRTLFPTAKDVENHKEEGELSDGDLAAEDEDTDIASGIESNSSSSRSSELSEVDCSEEDEPRRRATTSRKSGGNQGAKKTPRGKSIAERRVVMTPSMPSRRKKTEQPQTDIEKALSKLHVCAVPDQLPCREDQFAEIYDFVEGKLVDQIGSCMYISGVPGTGKTATVREVIRTLQDSKQTGDVPEFKFIEINGMKLSEPNQAYVQILRQLNGRKATADSAADILTGIFKSKRKSSDAMTVLLVDELDLLWTRKQQVLYNIFDWPTHPNSRLVVVAIANTMDLPERMVMNKVASRMGLSRMTFQPYTFQELQEIVKARLSGLELMDPDAVQFISRKVAALSGDARRALDVCRRAVELSENCDDVQASPSKRAKKYAVTMVHVNMAVKEMFTSSKIVAMQALSFHEKLALRAIVSEFRRTGVEECVFHKVNSQYTTLARLEGVAPLKTSLLSRALARMASSRLLILSDPRNDFQQKISLNATADDVNFALREQNDCDG